MIIDNDYIAEQFSLLGKVMDIHGENSFKTRSYSVAAYTIERLPQQIMEMAPEKVFAIRGIGTAIGKKIAEIINCGELSLLREFIAKTPAGVLEMLHIKGLGPKKIATIWKEMELESLGELLYACQENRLLLYKGFGEKTQNNVREAIEFYFRNQGSHLYADLEAYAQAIDTKLKSSFPDHRFALTGQFIRQLEVIDHLEWVTTLPPVQTREFFEANGFSLETGSDQGETANPSHFKGPEGIHLKFYFTPEAGFTVTLFENSCSTEFLEAWRHRTNWDRTVAYPSEEQIFSAASIHYIPSCRREQAEVIHAAATRPLPASIQPEDIRAIIHSHSNWSDGSDTLEEMAAACIEKGYEYLVISDHSKSAFYANGLKEERIKEQHHQVDELNARLAPFTIFKSIESDILNDGALDYSDSILSTFDLVIASVHSNLKMTEEKAMMRLLRAIENPYTTILGHSTGRLLLSRPGYPVDHKRMIDACAANKVVIELNAHPRRLDMDWRWIGYALEKGVLISVDPDAHSTEGYGAIKYGVLAAQKAGLTPEQNLSSFTLEKFKKFLAERRNF